MPQNGSRSNWFRDHPDPEHGPYPPAFLAEVDRIDAQHRARIAAMEKPGEVTIVGTQVLTVRHPAWWREHILRHRAKAESEHRARCREMSARV